MAASGTRFKLTPLHRRKSALSPMRQMLQFAQMANKGGKQSYAAVGMDGMLCAGIPFW